MLALGLDAPDQKEFSFPPENHPDSCSGEEGFCQHSEVWRPENEVGKRRRRLWHQPLLKTTRDPVSHYCSQGKSSYPRLRSPSCRKPCSHLPPYKRARSGASLSDLLRGTQGGCPDRNIPKAVSLESIKAVFYTGWLCRLFSHIATLRPGNVALIRGKSSLAGVKLGRGLRWRLELKLGWGWR